MTYAFYKKKQFFSDENTGKKEIFLRDAQTRGHLDNKKSKRLKKRIKEKNKKEEGLFSLKYLFFGFFS